MSVRVCPADAEAVAEAARLLREGRLVAFPTETVYGLGAVATDDGAVARVFLAKGRPADNPLIVHVTDREQAAAFAWFDDRAQRLARRFWPGPLTLVLPLKTRGAISPLATAGLATVAVRAPGHPVARALLEAVELPVAAPSANRSGAVSPTRAEHVVQDLGDRVALVLDAGPCPLGLESTVVDLSAGGAPLLLRPGAVPREAVEAELGVALARPGREDGPARSPGLLGRHYAPSTPLRLEAREVEPDEGLLAFGPEPLPGARITLNLSPKGSLEEAAANLYAMLRALDRHGLRRIAVMPIPALGLGEAINDRLRRAAAEASGESPAGGSQ